MQHKRWRLRTRLPIWGIRFDSEMLLHKSTELKRLSVRVIITLLDSVTSRFHAALAQRLVHRLAKPMMLVRVQYAALGF
jgi:hypothetical protein